VKMPVSRLCRDKFRPALHGEIPRRKTGDWGTRLRPGRRTTARQARGAEICDCAQGKPPRLRRKRSQI
jgi:hypothetical protein